MLSKYDKNCQIITPKKKKSGMVRVKAWAHPDIFTDPNPMVWVAKTKSPVYSMRVTIIGENKDLKGEK